MGTSSLSKAQFEAIFSEGKRASGPLGQIRATRGTGKIGFATSKKIGCHARRNKAKRRFREALRLVPEEIDSRLDYIFVISPNADQKPFSEIRAELGLLLTKMGERWENELGSS